MGCRLLKAVQGRGWCRSLNYLDRKIVLPSAIGTTFITLLLEELLRLGVRKTEEQFHTILSDDVVELREYLFCNFAVFEAAASSQESRPDIN